MNIINFLKNFCLCNPPLDEKSEEFIISQEISKKVAQTVNTIFKENYQFIMSLGSHYPNGCFLADGNRLSYVQNPQEFSSEDKEAGILLVEQVLRQAWGKVVEARHFPGNETTQSILMEEALYKVDILQDKLRQILPTEESVRIIGSECRPFILADTYKAKTKDLIKGIEASASHSTLNQEEKESLLRKVRVNLYNRDAAILVARERTKKNCEFLAVESGINKNTTLKVKLEGTPIAISKNAREDSHWEDANLAWMNELIASSVNLMTGGQFGAALSAWIHDHRLKQRTIHAFKPSQGHWDAAYDRFVPKKVAHIMALYYILLKAQDSHRSNILCRKDMKFNIPIPIDFGRILTSDPIHGTHGMFHFTKIGAWNGMNYPLCPEAKEFVDRLDAEQMMGKLKEIFLNHPSVDQETIGILERKLDHLKANVILLKEGAKMNLPPLALVAACTYKLLDSNLEKMEEIVKTSNGESATRTKLKRYMQDNCFSGFKHAWREATRQGGFDEKLFAKLIKAELKKMKGMNITPIYFNSRALNLFKLMKL